MNENRLNKELDSLYKKGVFKNKKIIIFSATVTTRGIRDFLRSKGISVYAILDNDERKWGTRAFGTLVYSPQELLIPYCPDYVILTNSQYQEEMKRQVSEWGYEAHFYGIFDKKWNIANDPIIEAPTMKGFLWYGIHFLSVYRLYKKWHRKYGNTTILLCPYQGMGDIYLICLYLRQYIEKENIKNCIMVVVNKACYKVAKLFDITEVVCISYEQSRALLGANQLFGDEIIPLKVMNDSFARTNGLWMMRGLHDINFDDMFRISVFGLPKNTVKIPPKRKNNSKNLLNFAEKNKILKNKTIIISPYSNTLMNEIPFFFWEELAKYLTSKGYMVYTNSSGEQEPEIPGTKGMLFPIELMVDILEYAGYFIGIRSGLCDVISLADCCKIILYPKDTYFGAGTFFNYFNMDKMGICHDAVEYEYKTTDDGLEVLKKYILSFFEDAASHSRDFGHE